MVSGPGWVKTRSYRFWTPPSESSPCTAALWESSYFFYNCPHAPSPKEKGNAETENRLVPQKSYHLTCFPETPEYVFVYFVWPLTFLFCLCVTYTLVRIYRDMNIHRQEYNLYKISLITLKKGVQSPQAFTDLMRPALKMKGRSQPYAHPRDQYIQLSPQGDSSAWLFFIILKHTLKWICWEGARFIPLSQMKTYALPHSSAQAVCVTTISYYSLYLTALQPFDTRRPHRRPSITEEQAPSSIYFCISSFWQGIWHILPWWLRW